MHPACQPRTADGLIRGVACALVPSLLAWGAIFALVGRIV
ncbi:hypothetical protein J2Y58_001534 [Sphingomonas sp. BE138]|nr:hypothetical protein [Sphingomonas sp. BE138]